MRAGLVRALLGLVLCQASGATLHCVDSTSLYPPPRPAHTALNQSRQPCAGRSEEAVPAPGLGTAGGQEAGPEAEWRGGKLTAPWLRVGERTGAHEAAGFVSPMVDAIDRSASMAHTRIRRLGTSTLVEPLRGLGTRGWRRWPDGPPTRPPTWPVPSQAGLASAAYQLEQLASCLAS